MTQEADGRAFDTVIPLFFDPVEFPYQADKEPFALYVGRLVPRKGIGVACESAAAAGIPLKVIGHGDPALVTHGAEYLGPMDWQTRNAYMARASAVITPTLYIEPFGGVAVEAQLCGTPVVCTDFGGFVETVEQGKTGYRCHYLGEFADGLHAARRLDPAYIRRRALALYSLEAVAPQYQAYLERLALLWDRGWDTLAARVEAVA
jgi:glycosyltransferase involved in cell wall biosynthesis